jgi:hypothetical protein
MLVEWYTKLESLRLKVTVDMNLRYPMSKRDIAKGISSIKYTRLKTF